MRVIDIEVTERSATLQLIKENCFVNTSNLFIKQSGVADNCYKNSPRFPLNELFDANNINKGILGIGCLDPGTTYTYQYFLGTQQCDGGEMNLGLSNISATFRTKGIGIPIACMVTLLSTCLSDESSGLSVVGAAGLTFSLTFIVAFIFGTTFGLALSRCLLRQRKQGDSTSAQEMTEGGVIYETPSDPVSAKKSEPETSGNIAYGVPQGVPVTPNPAYGQVLR